MSFQIRAKLLITVINVKQCTFIWVHCFTFYIPIINPNHLSGSFSSAKIIIFKTSKQILKRNKNIFLIIYLNIENWELFIVYFFSFYSSFPLVITAIILVIVFIIIIISSFTLVMESITLLHTVKLLIFSSFKIGIISFLIIISLKAILFNNRN